MCLVTVGGSGVGAGLLRRVIESLPHARERVPGLRMIAVCGPRIDPGTLPGPRRPRGVALRRPALAPSRSLRHRGRARRTHHMHGTSRREHAVPVLPATPPLRTDIACPLPARALQRRTGDGLRSRDTRIDAPQCRRAPHPQPRGKRRTRRRRPRRNTLSLTSSRQSHPPGSVQGTV